MTAPGPFDAGKLYLALPLSQAIFVRAASLRGLSLNPLSVFIHPFLVFYVLKRPGAPSPSEPPRPLAHPPLPSHNFPHLP